MVARVRRVAGGADARARCRLLHGSLPHHHTSRVALDGPPGRRAHHVGGRASAQTKGRPRPGRRARAGTRVRCGGGRVGASCHRRARHRAWSRARLPALWATRVLAGCGGARRDTGADSRDVRGSGVGGGAARGPSGPQARVPAVHRRRAVRSARTRRRRRVVDRHLTADLRAIRRAVRRTPRCRRARGRPAGRVPHLRGHDAAARSDCRDGTRRDGDVHAEGDGRRRAPGGSQGTRGIAGLPDRGI